MHPITLRAPRRRDLLPALLLALALSLQHAGAAPVGATTAPVTVIAAQGEVSLTAQGAHKSLHKGDEVPLPATLDTGPDGSLELQQGHTTVSLAPNSELTIPPPAVSGEAIDKIVQTHGNAFYSVEKRTVRKLHVETAYLVAVIKGTQFSVTAQDDSTTISLFEGRLEVRATDGSDVVDLEAGEIAIRHAGDAAIRMLRMDTGDPVARNLAPGEVTGAADAGAAGVSTSALLPPGSDSGSPVTAGTSGTAHPSTGVGGIALPAQMSAEAASGGAAGSVSAGVALGSAAASVSTTVATAVAGVSANTGATLSVSGSAASVNSGLSASVGSTSAGAALTASAAPSGVSAAATTSLASPIASTGAAVSASVTPSSTSLGTGASAATPVIAASSTLNAAASPSGTTLTAATTVSTPATSSPVAVAASVSGSSLGLSVSTPLTTLGVGTTGTTTATPGGSSASPTTPSNPVTTLVGGQNPIKSLLGH
jgi:hypothetical protein